MKVLQTLEELGQPVKREEICLHMKTKMHIGESTF